MTTQLDAPVNPIVARPAEDAATLRERGRARRRLVPRSQLGELPPLDRDPFALIEQQNAGRIPELVPLRYERMGQSVFSFYRGTAGLQAYDLAQQPHTELPVVVCGDAHLANFGIFASPERSLVFDLNDFDEAAPGPWEWDVYRLVTSVAIAARHLGFDDELVTSAARNAARRYRVTLRQLLDAYALDRYYFRVDERMITSNLDEATVAPFHQAIRKARKRTSQTAWNRLLAETDDGEHRFVEDPPVLTHARHVSPEEIQQLFRIYLRSVRPDIAVLVSSYRLTDIAHRVVGVGSVGTRCYVVALTGPSGGRVILQLKEAGTSVVEQYSGIGADALGVLPADAPAGRRVVSYQQVLQAVSDPFLGHLENGDRHFYVRQFRDNKASIDIDTLSVQQFLVYSSGCARLLARAHSQSPAGYAIGGYLGGGETADAAFARWAVQYLTRAEADYERFRDAAAPVIRDAGDASR